MKYSEMQDKKEWSEWKYLWNIVWEEEAKMINFRFCYIRCIFWF